MKKNTLLFLAGIFFFMVQGCTTVPTALSKERSVEIPESGMNITVSRIQYERPNFPRWDNPDPFGPLYYKPSDKSKCFAVLAMQILNVQKNERTDFYGITVENDTVVYHPVAAKYFDGNVQMGAAGAFLETKNERLGFTDMGSGVRTVFLLYECSSGERFSKVNFYGLKIVELETKTSKESASFGGLFE